MTDVTAGLFAVIGILLALRARESTGSGQFVDVSMLDSMISTMSSNYMSYLGSGIVPKPMGTAFPTVVPYRVFPHRRPRRCDCGGERETLEYVLRRDRAARFGDPSRITQPTPRASGTASRWSPCWRVSFARGRQPEWIESLHGAGIPASPVRNFKDVVEHPQSAVREMFPTVNHPKAGTHRVTGTPVKLSETPGAPGAPAPLLGQHTCSVLRDVLGLDETTIEELAARGAIYMRPAEF